MPRLDTIIVRLAGLTIAHLARSNHAMVDGLAALAALSIAIDAQREPLEDELHELVRRAGMCKQLRSAALEVKRAVHNRRPPKLPALRLDAVMAALSRSAQADLAKWLTNSAAFQSHKAALDMGIEIAINADVCGAIGEALADDGFNRALRSTSWALYMQLQPLRKAYDGGALSSAERKALVYISRAAWKTSPLSTFLHSGRLVLQTPQPGSPASLEIKDKYATTHANPALLDELERLRSLPASINTDVTVHRHRRAAATPSGAIRYLKGVYGAANAGNWRADSKSELALGGTVTHALFAIPASGQPIGEFLTALAASGANEAEAHAIVRILEREGVITLTLQDTEFTALLNSLKEVLSEDAALDNPRWNNADEVAVLLTDIRQSIGAATATIRPNDARYEHGVACLSGSVLDNEMEQCLTELETLLPDYLVVNPAYAALAHAWHHSCGGASTVPLQRLLEAYAASTPVPATAEFLLDASTLLTAGTRAPVTAFFQIACQPDGYRLVLNQAQTFSLSQSLRALPADPRTRAELLATYRTWLHTLYGGTEPVEVPMCNQCNGLQDHPRLTTEVLDWGNETNHAAPCVAIEDVQVGFDKQSYRFCLTDERTGRALSLVYLGGLVPQPTWGDAYPLTVLSNPFQVALPSLLDAEFELGNTYEVAHAPRLERGRIVLRRALWRVPSREILRLLAGTRSDAFLALRDFCSAYAIPTHVFMRPSAGGDRAKYYRNKTFRKPMFFDAGNPALYPALVRLAKLAEHVVLVEAMPGPNNQWLERVAGQRRVSELQVEFAL